MKIFDKNNYEKNEKNSHILENYFDKYDPLKDINDEKIILYLCSGDEEDANAALFDRSARHNNMIFYDINHKKTIDSNNIEQIQGTMFYLPIKEKKVYIVYMHPLEKQIQELSQYDCNKLCKEIDRVIENNGKVVLDMEFGGRRNMQLDFLKDYKDYRPYKLPEYYHNCICGIPEFFEKIEYKRSEETLGNYLIFEKI